MDLTQHLKEATFNLYLSKMRSLLAVLGILIGSASVVALVSGGQIATQNALAQFKTLGTDLLAVSISATDSTGNGDTGSLSLIGAESLQEKVPNISILAPYTMAFTPISYRGKSINGGVVGATETLQDILKLKMKDGRFVSHLDGDAPYCVIGNKIAAVLRQSGMISPVGKQIQLGTDVFTIIGVVGPTVPNAFVEADIDQTIIVPLETSLLLSKYTQIRNIIFRLKSKTNIKGTEAEITKGIQAVTTNQKLFFRSAEELIASMEKQQETFTWLLGFIGGISLIVGGIGVMNIMLVSITERRREIGIRMAIGAKRRDIQLMFLIEAVALTLFGGFLGIIIGVLLSYVIALFAGWTFMFFALPPVIGSGVSILTGVFFGFYPAFKASRLDPIETLRAE